MNSADSTGDAVEMTAAEAREARYELAKRVAAAVDAYGGQTGRAWEKEGMVRVYVSQTLSRGRRDEMGYIEICRDFSRNYNTLQKRRAGIRDAVEAALSAAG